MKPRILIALLFLCVTALLLWGSSCTQVTTPPVNGEPDTTSHNFVFETFVLGDGNSSSLYDVAIVNDTLAYAVGEIYLKDSTGQLDPNRYNATVWNGGTWNVIRIPYFYQGQPFHNPIQTINAISNDDIWFAGNGIIHWNGQQYIPVEIPSQVWGAYRINSIWGNANEFYIVGDGGSMARYAGGGWQKIESSTTMDIRDIHGYVDPFNGKRVLLGVASSSSGVRILSLSQSTVRDTLAWQVNDQLSSIWVSNQFNVYAGGPGIWKHDGLVWQQVDSLPVVFYNKVRGTGENNIFVAGRDVLAHYNGASWHVFSGIPADFRFRSVAVSKNVVIAVGFTVSGAIAGNAAIVVGKRIH